MTTKAQREAASRQASAEDFVSSIYERIGRGKGLTRNQVDALKRILGNNVRGKVAGGAKGRYYWEEMDGRLLDPEGEECGFWRVSTLPNGAGNLKVTVLMTRPEREAKVSELERQLAEYLAFIDELIANPTSPRHTPEFAEEHRERLTQEMNVKIEAARQGFRDY